MIAQNDLKYYRKEVKIDTVENGVKAIEKFKEGQYDIILMDVQMHEMNGFDVTKAIRKIENSENLPSMPIMAMTASLLKALIEKCLQAAMDDYIPKSYKAEELIGTIYKRLEVV